MSAPHLKVCSTETLLPQQSDDMDDMDDIDDTDRVLSLLLLFLLLGKLIIFVNIVGEKATLTFVSCSHLVQSQGMYLLRFYCERCEG